MIPTMDVARTQMKIAESETLRLAPIGPGLPGTYVSPDVLRSTTGRTLGARPGASSSTPSPDVGVDGGVVRGLAAALRETADSFVGCGSGDAWCHAGSYRLTATALEGLRLNEYGRYDPRRVRSLLSALGPDRIAYQDTRIVSGRSPLAAAMGGYTIARLIADIDGGRYSAPSSTPSSADVNAGLLRSRDFVLRSGGGVSPSEQPTGGGMMSPMPMPTLSPEEMERLRAGVGLPAGTASDFFRGLSFGQIAGGITGFAVGLGLLLLRRK
jgi:hypothetical protein